MTQMRVVAAKANARDKGKPDPASSILKIKGSEIQQTITELLMEVVGPFALPFADEDDAGLERTSGRTGLCRPARARLFQLPQGFDLRRLQRNSEEHHRESDPRPLTAGAGEKRKTRVMDFEFSEEQQLLKDSIEGLLGDKYDFETAQEDSRKQRTAGAARSGSSLPSSACSACPSPKRMAASAAVRSKP
jgi:hypothetical protein